VIPANLIVGARSSCPMHPTYRHSTDAGYDKSTPYVIHPVSSPVEKQGQGQNTNADGNSGGSDDELQYWHDPVVGGSPVAEIMHTRHGCSAAYTADHKGHIPRSRLAVASVEPVGNCESKENYHNGQDGRDGCECWAIVKLDRVLAISKHNGAVANKMHAPNGNQTKGHCTCT